MKIGVRLNILSNTWTNHRHFKIDSLWDWDQTGQRLWHLNSEIPFGGETYLWSCLDCWSCHLCRVQQQQLCAAFGSGNGPTGIQVGWVHEYRIHTCSNNQCSFEPFDSRFYSRFQRFYQGFKVLFRVSRFYSRFQGFCWTFCPWGLESEVAFAHNIPYEQVHEFY